MRFLLTLWLAIGLTPGLGEVAETFGHFVSASHLAHSVADDGDLGDQGNEHSCGATLHHCGCCASQFVAPARQPGSAVAMTPGRGPVTRPEVLALTREPAPPFRPPIAS